LLEGLDSLKKYEQCGESDSIIKLVGMPKFDDYINQKRDPDKDIKNIGVAINPSDDQNEVFILLEELNKTFNSHKILLRPHPKDNRPLRSSKFRLDYSDSKSESAFDFLTGIDLLISGGSSIHLEAALLHIPCIMYGFNHEKEITDTYGYLRNGLVQKADNPETVIRLIKENNIKINIDKLSYYNAVLDTEWEGKSKELITNILTDFLN
jgi:CDP-glycerol glycerophosphotransferase (TagB/SpsB family)